MSTETQTVALPQIFTQFLQYNPRKSLNKSHSHFNLFAALITTIACHI